MDISRKRYIQTACIIVVSILLVELGVHYADGLILGKLPIASLSESALTSTVSESLGSNGSPLSVDKDYKIQSMEYFVNNTWAVVSIIPINNDANPAVLILQKRNGTWSTVAGPGSDFPTNALPSSTPTQVTFYLNTQGLISR